MEAILAEISKQYPLIGAFLLVFGSISYLIYFITKSSKEERQQLQGTLSRQHKEALDVTNKVIDAHVENTKVLTELKVIIQTINK